MSDLRREMNSLRKRSGRNMMYFITQSRVCQQVF